MFTITNPSLDVDLSQIWFNDWKANLEFENQLLMLHNRNGVDYIVLAEDLSKPYYKKSDLIKMKKSELIDLCYELDVYFNDSYTKTDIVSEIMSLVDLEYYYKKHYENHGWGGVDYDFRVVGYSQGDCVKVNILSDVLKWNTKESLTNLLFDTPIYYGKIEFLDQEVNLDEYAEDFYSWDLDGLISNFEKSYKGWYKQRLIDIIKNLPDPEY